MSESRQKLGMESRSCGSSPGCRSEVGNGRKYNVKVSGRARINFSRSAVGQFKSGESIGVYQLAMLISPSISCDALHKRRNLEVVIGVEERRCMSHGK